MRLTIAFSLVTLFTMSCQNSPKVRLEDKDIELSRVEPDLKRCDHLGAIEGRTAKVSGTQDDAFQDLKNAAKDRGANYLKVEQSSATSVRAQAYLCK